MDEGISAKAVLLWLGVVAMIIGLGIGGCTAWNTIRVWNATKAGEAELAQATSNRQIKVLEAKAKKESAIFEAEAEVERAKGAAQANHILQNSMGGPDNYLRYLQIQALENTKATMIYVPTEGGLPVTEAGRLRSAPAQ